MCPHSVGAEHSPTSCWSVCVLPGAQVVPFPEAGPAEPEAPSLGFALGIPYDYDYLFDASGDNVVVGASTVNEVGGVGLSLKTPTY